MHCLHFHNMDLSHISHELADVEVLNICAKLYNYAKIQLNVINCITIVIEQLMLKFEYYICIIKMC